MNRDELYLISEEAYLSHINDKVRLYAMLKQLTMSIRELPSNRGNKRLSHLASVFGSRSEEMFRSWGIPESYLIFGDENALRDLMDSELFDPEEMGLVPCDECDCGNEKAEKPNAKEAGASDIGGMLDILGEVMHTLFGDNVTVHVFKE